VFDGDVQACVQICLQADQNVHVNDARAVRVSVSGAAADASLCEEVRARAAQIGVRGWVRLMDDGTASAHVEGPPSAVDELIDWLGGMFAAGSVTQRAVRVEGHEQFAIRGVPAGVFVVQEHQATAHHFDFRLEVDGVMRSWAVPKGPSMDPTVKRLAVEVEDHGMAHNDFEGRAGRGGVIIWDRGTYEQGGRVAWPEAIERGHAVFVLHGEKLEGGFALQRTGRGEKPQWLLIKRSDEHARRGSDVAAERPESVQSGVTLAELLDETR
jgi:DNA ligase D-like protein (predicted 3'-phosphoesterase)